MPLVGIIAKKREFQAIKKELQDCNIELIHLNKKTIKNSERNLKSYYCSLFLSLYIKTYN